MFLEQFDTLLGVLKEFELLWKSFLVSRKLLSVERTEDFEVVFEEVLLGVL